MTRHVPMKSGIKTQLPASPNWIRRMLRRPPGLEVCRDYSVMTSCRCPSLIPSIGNSLDQERLALEEARFLIYNRASPGRGGAGELCVIDQPVMTAAMCKPRTLVLIIPPGPDPKSQRQWTFLPRGPTGISGSHKEYTLFLSPSCPRFSSSANNATSLQAAPAGNSGISLITSTPLSA